MVTRYHLKLHALPKAIYGSTHFYHLDDAPAIGHWLGKAAPHISPAVELSQFIIQAPPDLKDAAAARNGWLCMVTGTAFEDSPEAARAALWPLEQSPVKPLSSTVAAPLTFEHLFDASGALWPEGLRSRVEATYSDHSPGDMMQTVLPLLPQAPSARSVFLFTIFCGPQCSGSAKGHGLFDVVESLRRSVEHVAGRRRRSGQC